MELAFSEIFARLDVLLLDGHLYQDVAPLSLGTCDVKDAFPRVRLRESLAPYSGIGQGTVRELHAPYLHEARRLATRSSLLAALPLGFSWSLFFNQRFMACPVVRRHP